MTPLLEMRDVSMRFGPTAVLSGLSLELAPGEIVGLIGPNGTGKTTLFNLISGTLAPSQGDILFRGRSLLALAPHERARLGIRRAFQTPRAYRALTVEENLRSVCSSPGHVLRLAARMGLEPCLSQRAQTLSTPILRRLDAALALAPEPELALLDEPFAGQDARERAWLAGLLREARGAGRSALLIEHRMEVVADLCDRAIVIHGGTVLARGTPEQVLKAPAVLAAYSPLPL